MKTVYRFIAVLFLALGLVACGGGGSSASGDFQLSANSLNFTAPVDASYIPSQTLIMSSIGSGAYYVGAGTPDGSSLPTWLTVSSLSYADGFLVSVNTWGACLPGRERQCCGSALLIGTAIC